MLFAFIVSLRAKRSASEIVAIPLGLRTDDSGSDTPPGLKSGRQKAPSSKSDPNSFRELFFTF